MARDPGPDREIAVVTLVDRATLVDMQHSTRGLSRSLRDRAEIIIIA